MPYAQVLVEAMRALRWLRLPVIVLATGSSAAGYAQTAMPPPGLPPSQTPPQGAAPPAAVLGPPTLRLSGFTSTLSIDLSETYTTNVYGVGTSATTSVQDDFITSLGVSLGLHDHTLRFDGDLNLRVVGDHYASNSSFDRIYSYVNGLATLTLVPEHLIVRGSVFATPLLINNLGPLGAGGRPVAAGPNSGLRDTYGYSIGPVLAFRLGDFATSETSATQSSAFFVEPNGLTVADTVPGQIPATEWYSYSIAERLSSGSDFNRLNWTITGLLSESTQSGLDFKQASGVADTQYAVSREFAILASFGYQSLTSNQTLIEDLVGPLLMGGVRLTLGPSFEISASAGQQFDYPSYVGNIRYQVGGFTTFFASLTDTVTTPAGRLIGGLGQMGVDNRGGFIDTTYQPAASPPPPSVPGVTSFNPVPLDGIGFTNSIQRYRVGSASFVHLAERTQYRLTAFRTAYDTLTLVSAGIPTQGEAIGGQLAVFRTMTPELNGGVEANYSVQDQFGIDYDIFGGSLTLNYSFSPRTQSYFRAAYLERRSDPALTAVSPLSGDLSDTIVTIGIRRQL